MLDWFPEMIKLPVIVFSILTFRKALSGFARRSEETRKIKQRHLCSAVPHLRQFEASQWTGKEEPCYAQPSDGCLTEYNQPSEKSTEAAARNSKPILVPAFAFM